MHIYVAPGSVSVARAQQIPGVNTVHDDGSSVVISTKVPSEVLSVPAALDALQGLRVKGASLEDVILTLTGREYRA